MKIKELMLGGAYVIDPKKDKDTVGATTEMFDAESFAAEGLHCDFKRFQKFSIGQKATVHGLTYQLSHIPENRLFWCTKGSAYSVIIDLRPDSPTYEVFYGAELHAEPCILMYIPHGFAHGFLTLEDNTEAMCLSTAPFSKDSLRGIRYNDRKFRIQWPINPRSMSLQDRRYPDYES